ncbi:MULTISPECIES: RidA family protein [unclassified Beijerinckia]|uniref:RidA family protein n=1 Tax=unclassified Beijerinckia TaxID=2638183 RepID=UPI00089D10E8|nr:MULTISPECIES: RidA family protein [unclassified Beijerinckia]MDH7796001.1 2-iminobutanoate/2-iminopropanoate deaminase [Beijerinckia sp. GAS462]SEC25806.1 2-iminobutanoate/2-iminopropanoate deaminase [Beijerinckia sp. 28-YEA-48]
MGAQLDRQSMAQSPEAPERMAGMVPGVRAGGFLFLSAVRGREQGGGMSDDPLTQARQALKNLEAILAASGATLAHVVKVTLYLHDLEKRTPFHQAWMEFFPQDPPARIAVCVADANAAPGGKAHFALDVIALAP